MVIIMSEINPMIAAHEGALLPKGALLRTRASDLVLKLCAVQYATNFGVNILVTQRCVCQPSLGGGTTHTDDSSNLVTLYMAQMHLPTIRSSSSPVQQERAQPASMR